MESIAPPKPRTPLGTLPLHEQCHNLGVP
jgi:hypothetical protein